MSERKIRREDGRRWKGKGQEGRDFSEDGWEMKMGGRDEGESRRKLGRGDDRNAAKEV